MRVLITGASGQVGKALRASLPNDVDAYFATHADLDVGDRDQVHEYVRSLHPDLIINAAAYTAVDKAENDRAAASRVNTLAAGYLAEAASRIDRARLIQISTDFVFDGIACRPYPPDHEVAPLNVYGETKVGGEAAVVKILGDKGVIVRSAWIYSTQGHNFFRTMLRVLKERGEASVVDDQVGTPTAALSLARVLWAFAMRPDLSGIYHWTDAGVASWYDFAVAIAEEGREAGVLAGEVNVKPIPTRSYPTPAKRPSYSVLDKRSTIDSLGVAPEHWRAQLRSVMREWVGA